jgi:CRP/FNR family transcriptional regulator, cyclic AMP receptor protein
MVHYNQNITCNECENSNCLIKQCNPEWIELLNSKKNQSIFRKGQYIIIEGNPVFGVFFIQSGKVKVVSTNFNGKEQVVRLATSGHLLGHRGMGGEKYPIAAVTLDDARICFIDNQSLFDAFMANPLFTYKLMMFYSIELRKSEQRTKYLSQMTVEEKIIFALIYITETFNAKDNEQFSITLNRSDIANIAGTNADQVSRTISYLKRKNIIETVGRSIIVKEKSKLEELINHYMTYAF